MADQNIAPDQVPQTTEGADSPKGTGDELKTFFASTTGKIVLAAVGVAAIVGILGVVAFFVFGGGFGGGGDAPTVPPIGQGTTQSPSTAPSGTGESSETPEPPEEVAVADVYTFRDIFAATVKPTKISTTTTSSASSDTSGSSSGGSSSGGSSATSSDDTLYLTDIVSEDGKQVAVFSYNGTEYKLTEGQRVGDTPWKVLEIGDNSVVMLYGDTQVTLSVGQGLTK